MEDAPYNEKLSFILKWIFVLLFLIMLFVIYIPNNIWAKEKQIRKLAQWKMSQLWDAQRMYHSLTNSYNDDLKATLRFVSQIRDSILADSMYTGEQYINFGDNRIKVTIPPYWDFEYDTAFAFPYDATDTTYETIYTAAVPNPQTGMNDTIYLNKRRDTYVYKDSLWEGKILDTTLDMRIEKVQKYKRFNLVDSLLICPLTMEEYFTERTKDNKIRIVSPTRGGVRFPIYHFWTFEDTGHGFIEDGEASWAKY